MKTTNDLQAPAAEALELHTELGRFKEDLRFF